MFSFSFFSMLVHLNLTKCKWEIKTKQTNTFFFSQTWPNELYTVHDKYACAGDCMWDRGGDHAVWGHTCERWMSVDDWLSITAPRVLGPAAGDAGLGPVGPLMGMGHHLGCSASEVSGGVSPHRLVLVPFAAWALWLTHTSVLPSRGHWGFCLSVLLVAPSLVQVGGPSLSQSYTTLSQPT